MRTITIKHIPDDLYDQLRRHAKMNRRSVNSEVIACIEKAMRSQKMTQDVALMRARKLREKTYDHPITDEEFIQAKAMGATIEVCQKSVVAQIFSGNANSYGYHRIFRKNS